jgi:hypothetical protein
MGRHSLRYSDDQRQAIARAVLDDGLTAREAVERAAAGELGIPPFDVPLSTAQGFVTETRRDRPPDRGDAEKGRLRELADRAIAVIETEMAKVEAGSQRGSLELPRIKRTLQAAQHLARLEQILAAPKAPPVPTSHQADASARKLREAMLRDLTSEQTAPAHTATRDRPGEEARRKRNELLAELQAVAEEAEPQHTNGRPSPNSAPGTAVTPG